MSKKILWLSQHSPLGKQIDELKRLLGGVDILQDVNSFNTADEVLRRYRSGGYEDLVFVGPLSVLEQLCKRGLCPLRAEMEELSSERRSEADLAYRGRYFRFDRFVRVKAVIVQTEELN